MEVTVSPKYQVVIPEAIRTRLGIRAGEKLQIFAFDNRIELVRIRPLREMRGFLKGLDIDFKREKKDRF